MNAYICSQFQVTKSGCKCRFELHKQLSLYPAGSTKPQSEVAGEDGKDSHALKCKSKGNSEGKMSGEGAVRHMAGILYQIHHCNTVCMTGQY